MRTTDIIRNVLDLIDRVEDEKGNIDASIDVHVPDSEPSRFKQIFAMLSNQSKGPLANSPNEVVAPIDAVTTDAGGGINGPKHPDDIRVKDPRGYE